MRQAAVEVHFLGALILIQHTISKNNWNKYLTFVLWIWSSYCSQRLWQNPAQGYCCYLFHQTSNFPRNNGIIIFFLRYNVNLDISSGLLTLIMLSAELIIFQKSVFFQGNNGAEKNGWPQPLSIHSPWLHWGTCVVSITLVSNYVQYKLSQKVMTFWKVISCSPLPVSFSLSLELSFHPDDLWLHRYWGNIVLFPVI